MSYKPNYIETKLFLKLSKREVEILQEEVWWDFKLFCYSISTEKDIFCKERKEAKRLLHLLLDEAIYNLEEKARKENETV